MFRATPPRRPHATAQQVGAAVDMYFDGLSYRRTAENIGDYFERPTTPAQFIVGYRSGPSGLPMLWAPRRSTPGASG